MFLGRKLRTRPPAGNTPRKKDFEELFQRDLEKKMRMKTYTDSKKGVKTSDFQVGDAVLVKQEPGSKATPSFEGELLEVQYRKGTQAVAKRRDDSTITRTRANFEKVPYQTSEEAGRWKPGPEISHREPCKPNAETTELPQMEEHPQEVQLPEGDDLNLSARTFPPADCSVEPPQPPLL